MRFLHTPTHHAIAILAVLAHVALAGASEAILPVANAHAHAHAQVNEVRSRHPSAQLHLLHHETLTAPQLRDTTPSTTTARAVYPIDDTTTSREKSIIQPDSAPAQLQNLHPHPQLHLQQQQPFVTSATAASLHPGDADDSSTEAAQQDNAAVGAQDKRMNSNVAFVLGAGVAVLLCSF